MTEETWVKDLAGLSLRNVDVSLWKHGKKLASQFGEMLFTHTGVSGPVILMLSSQAAHKPKWEFPMQLRINLKPALTPEMLDARIQRDFQKYLRKQAGNGLQDLLPRHLIPYVLGQAEIPEQTLINQITRTQRQDLVTVLQAFSLTLTGTRPIEEAIVTAGGVSVREINPGTMESKKIRSLYFAGEVIDIDAFTGGYNLQAAFSMWQAALRQRRKQTNEKNYGCYRRAGWCRKKQCCEDGGKSVTLFVYRYRGHVSRLYLGHAGTACRYRG